jgi:hypothetical protein
MTPSELAKWDAYRITKQGPNEWTSEALHNVIALHQHFDAARDLVGGRFSSVFRDARVNRIVGGANNSAHLYGLACDIVPRDDYSPSVAARIILHAASQSKLGPIEKVIIEPGWVHVGWTRLLSGPKTIALMRKEGKRYPTIGTVRVV